MHTTLPQLSERLPDLLQSSLLSRAINLGELTLEVKAADIHHVCTVLRDEPLAQFDQLIDLCGMDYLTYGVEEGVGQEGDQGGERWPGSRYAVVYHLLSLPHNFRLRIRAALEEDDPAIDSVITVWSAADWFEREAFDLYGIIFNQHPDLRRLLTDYGFIGHPFRKDFPLSGQVEMRYDEQQKRVVYQPVTIEPRTLVPRTIRKDVPHRQ